MTWLWRWIKRAILLICICLIGLILPVIYVETACRSGAAAEPYDALIAPEHHRPETRTLMTYPEWHIVHAYEDYGEVLSVGDPHNYGFLRGIGGFWTSLCALSREAGAHGDVDGSTKQMVYVIGVSFTAELLLKAAYEETIGRLVTILRGPVKSGLDDLSAEQAADYAAFLQQVPWYKWPFRRDAEALRDHASADLRDRERQVALGLEYSAKAAYADVIAQAVSQVGPDALTLRMIVAGADADDIAAYDGVAYIAQVAEGIEVETPRYRDLTNLLQDMAASEMDFIEIAGNDDILFTALSPGAESSGALFSARRQGFGDYRHLFVVKVRDLANRLRDMETNDLTLEHIHDY